MQFFYFFLAMGLLYARDELKERFELRCLFEIQMERMIVMISTGDQRPEGQRRV